jgi:hypothetical protein
LPAVDNTMLHRARTPIGILSRPWPPTSHIALDPVREEAEAAQLLGDDFGSTPCLQHYQDHLDAEFADIAHEDTFYLTSKAYLYNLTAFG